MQGKKQRERYRRLDRAERAAIQSGLDKGRSCRQMARDLGRSPSTVADEVARNRTVAKGPGKGDRVRGVPDDDRTPSGPGRARGGWPARRARWPPCGDPVRRAVLRPRSAGRLPDCERGLRVLERCGFEGFARGAASVHDGGDGGGSARVPGGVRPSVGLHELCQDFGQNSPSLF